MPCSYQSIYYTVTFCHGPAGHLLVMALQSVETSYFSLNSLYGTCGFLLPKMMLNLLKSSSLFTAPSVVIYTCSAPSLAGWAS